jgi:hypothetical protein
MKVSHFVVVAMLAAGCSADQQAEQEAQRETARETAPAPAATSGGNPPPPAPAAPERRETDASDAKASEHGVATTEAVREGVNPRAAVLDDFKERIEDYVDVRGKAIRDGDKLRETDNPAELTTRQAALAARIAALRANAKHGDVFTPEIRNTFRRLLAPELKGEDGRDTKAVLKDDAPPPGSVPLKINAKYPEGLPRPTVPANLLLNLPALPKGLEYRIVGKHLVLLDIDADIVIDYIANVMA